MIAAYRALEVKSSLHHYVRPVRPNSFFVLAELERQKSQVFFILELVQ